MKHVFFLLALTAATAGLQAQKYGYVNSLELINLMPESAVADSLLKAYQQEVQAQYNAYLQEYSTKSQEYFRVKDSVSQFVAESKLSDLQGLESRIKEFETNSNNQLTAKREELFQPILVRASELVEEIAQEHNFRMIFDTSSGAIAYAPEGDNVIGLLKKKLGLE